MPEMHPDQNEHTTGRETGSELNSHLELLIFRVGPHLLGIPAEETGPVVPWRSPTPLPRAPKAVLGVVSVRGRMLTVLDPLALLHAREASDTTPAGSYILPLRGDEQLALLLDQLERVNSIAAAEIGPDETGSSSKVVQGTIKDERGNIIRILDTQELFTTAMEGVERRRRRS